MNWITPKNRKWWTLATVCLALLMIVLDGNVVNLAIPKIMRDFGATISQMEWVSNAYLLTFAVFLITFGRLGDELGRKRFFIGGLVVFIIGSLLCGIAKNTGQLIAFRSIQGLGGAAMMPATLSLIAANFEKKERGAAMGLWGAVSGLGIVLGPIVGGYLTDRGLGTALNSFFHVSDFWRYVFYINLPIGIAAVILAGIVIKESKDQERTHYIDIPGILLSSLSVFLITYGFIEGAKYGWWKVVQNFTFFGHNLHFGTISVIPVMFALAIIFLIIFILVEKKCKKDPLVDMEMFKNRNFSVGTFAASVLSFAMMGAFFLLPLFLQIVMGFAPIKTGQVLLPFAFTIMLVSPIAGRLADKIGGKSLIVAGLVIMSLGAFFIAHFRVDTAIKNLILPFIVMGIGMGLSMSPLTNITLLDTPEDEVGGASGVISTSRQIGSVMGIAILGAFLVTSLGNITKTNLDKIAGLSDQAKIQIVEAVKNQGFSSDTSKIQQSLQTSMAAQVPNVVLANPQQRQVLMVQMQKTGTDVMNAIKQSFVDSMNKTFKIAALIALFGALIALFFRSDRGFKKESLTVE